MMRRCSAGADGRMMKSTVPVRANIDEMWQHLRHLGPSNRANNPKNTRSTTVKIKQGHSYAGPQAVVGPVVGPNDAGSPLVQVETGDGMDAGETTGLLSTRSGSPTDSRAAFEGYGTTQSISHGSDADLRGGHMDNTGASDASDIPVIETSMHSSGSVASRGSGKQKYEAIVGRGGGSVPGDSAARSSSENSPSHTGFLAAAAAAEFSTPASRRSLVRSGSITENIIETHGIRKVVLATASSTEDDEEAAGGLPSSYVQRPSPLSGVQSPAVHSAHATDSEDEAALLASQPAAPSLAPAVALEPTGRGSQLDGAAADHEDSASAVNGGGPAKKKNRRKKRKNAK